jgi:hypothetical protein
MYIIQFDEHGDLYAEGQFHKIYNGIDTTLIYLFFKYPDWLSTIPEMCALSQYPTNYRFLPENYNLPLNILQEIFFVNDIEDIEKIDKLEKVDKMINRVQIKELFENASEYETFKQTIMEGREKTIEQKIENDEGEFTFVIAEKCEGYDFSADGVRFVTIDGSPRIELIRNLKSEFNTVNKDDFTSLCNDSIDTFYKQPELQEIFSTLRQSIEIISAIRRSKRYSRRTNKSKKSRKSRKTLRSVKHN